MNFSNLDERESKFVELLVESPKAWSEIKKNGGDILKYPTTINNVRKRLLRRNIIEKITIEDPNSEYLNKYRLTEEYKQFLNEEKLDSNLDKILKDQLIWQSTFRKLIRYLEFEYPIFLNKSNPRDFKEVYNDAFNYMVHFNLTNLNISGQSKKYWDFILYLMINHPDRKYDFFKDKIEFNFVYFHNIIENYFQSNKLEKFILRCEDNSPIEKYYLISDDPILYELKQNIEVRFSKFFICWQFPGITLEKNFDFLLHFSKNILDLSYSSNTDSNIISFFDNFKICIQIFIREYIYERLIKLSVSEDQININEYPLNLLPSKQKKQLREKLLLSPQILTPNDIINIMSYYFVQSEKCEQKKENIKRIINKLAERLTYYIENQKKAKEILYLKSHLLLLIRLFYKYYIDSFNEFIDLISSRFDKISFSYSKLSEEIFESIKNLKIGLKSESKFYEKDFAIRNLIERIDHLLENINFEKSHTIHKIHEIFELAINNFSKKVRYPFLKKQIEIFNLHEEVYSEQEIKETFKKVINLNPFDNEILDFLFLFLIKTKDTDFFHNIVKKVNWELGIKIDAIIRYIKGTPSGFNMKLFFENFIISIKQNLGQIEKPRKIIALLKIFAYFMKKKNKLFDSLLLCYFSSEVELIPKNRDPLDSLFIESIECWKLNSFEFDFSCFSISLMIGLKGELNKKQISLEFSNNLDMLTYDFYNYIFDESLERELVNLKKSIPNLLNILMDLKEVILKIQNKILNNSKKNNNNINQKNKIINYISKNSNLRDKIQVIKKHLKNFIETRKNSNYSYLINYLDSLLNNNRIKKLNDYYYDVDLNTSNSDLDQKIERKINNSFSKYPKTNGEIENQLKKNVLNCLNLIEYYFKPSIKEKSEYPFNLAFEKKYQINKNIDYSELEKKSRIINSKGTLLIEFLDVLIFGRSRLNIQMLERLVIIIFNHYGIDWAVRYIYIFKNFYDWYIKRVDQLKLPFSINIEESERVSFLLDFYTKIIKANVYLKDLDKEKAKNCLKAAKDNIDKVKSIFSGSQDFISYYEKMKSYNRKLFT